MRNVTITNRKSVQSKVCKVADVEAWSLVAKDLIRELKAGDIITLQGPLGAGKTTFVQALAKELGVKKTPQSPTFSLVRSYAIPRRTDLKRIVHIDAYRIDDERDLLALDLDAELLEPGTIMVIEWPEKIPMWIHARAKQIIHLQIQ
ncbi:MAG: tRNA (adenosine(37)-N6)-threonylcarbamoyltransferase complex ATPase subunit type 1 TsaE [bacterium]|nr:tRNA (adenosine(37)-N6)-threonylcarbamoyltransferase complex ATPase subunit type 1 TsaE [bacterium]